MGGWAKLILAGAWVGAAAFATPQLMRVDGSVYDNAGNAVSGTHSVVVRAYDASTAGNLLWTSAAYGSVVITNAKFTVDMDASTGAPSLVQQLAAAQTSGAIWFEISYDAAVVRPRVRARGTAFALSSASTDGLRGIAVSTATPGTSSVLSYNGTQWAPTAVTSLVSGNYLALAGGTMSGNLSLLTLSSASINVSSLSATHLVRADTAGNLVSVTAAVADSDIANIAGTTANIQTQLNAKQGTVTQGTLAGSGAISVANGASAVIGTGVTLSIATATTSTNGILTQTDWNTFNGKVSSQWTTTGSNLYYATGSVGIGLSSSPTSALEVHNGAIVSDSVANSVAYINFGAGNVQMTSTAATTLNLCGLKDGGTYTLVLTGIAASSTVTMNAYPTYVSTTACSGTAIQMDFGAGASTIITAGNTTIISLVYFANRGANGTAYGSTATNYNY